jgi:hypothetical protein
MFYDPDFDAVNEVDFSDSEFDAAVNAIESRHEADVEAGFMTANEVAAHANAMARAASEFDFSGYDAEVAAEIAALVNSDVEGVDSIQRGYRYFNEVGRIDDAKAEAPEPRVRDQAHAVDDAGAEPSTEIDIDRGLFWSIAEAYASAVPANEAHGQAFVGQTAAWAKGFDADAYQRHADRSAKRARHAGIEDIVLDKAGRLRRPDGRRRRVARRVRLGA